VKPTGQLYDKFCVASFLADKYHRRWTVRLRHAHRGVHKSGPTDDGHNRLYTALSHVHRYRRRLLVVCAYVHAECIDGRLPSTKLVRRKLC